MGIKDIFSNNEIKEENENLRHLVESLQKNISELTKSEKSLKYQNKILFDEVSNLKELIQKSKEENEHLKGENLDLQSNISELTKKNKYQIKIHLFLKEEDLDLQSDIFQLEEENQLSSEAESVGEESIEHCYIDKAELQSQLDEIKKTSETVKYTDTESAIQEIERIGTKLEVTLKNFGVNASIINICRGSSVTRFEIQLAPGVKMSKITNLVDDIGLNLATDNIRIEAPIPGKSTIGIEIPNKVRTIVTMSELLNSPEFRSSKAKMSVALGKDVSGNVIVINLEKMPHLFIVGITGSGKSVCLNSIITSLIYKATPEEVKLLLIDPKMVGFSKYSKIPHLFIPVITDIQRVVGALSWLVNEMEERYKNFSLFGVNNIKEFNNMVDKHNMTIIERTPEELRVHSRIDNERAYPKEKYSSIIVVIDDFVDLMTTFQRDTEEFIYVLLRKGEKAGIHLVVSTSKLTSNIITDKLKSSIPSYITFKLSSQFYSHKIIGTGGAEKLLGDGDMLFLSARSSKPIRIQGGYVSDAEIEEIISHIGSYKHIAEKQIIRDINIENYTEDDILEEAIKLVIENGQASTSFLQRRLRLGYARAGRLIDKMEQMGIIGSHVGSKSREVLITYEEWLKYKDNMDE